MSGSRKSAFYKHRGRMALWLLGLCTGLLWCGCSSPNTRGNGTGHQGSGVLENQGPKAFAEGIRKEKAVVIDFRTSGECAEGRLPGSMNVDFYNEDEMRSALDALDKNQPYYVYCRSGGRSAQAAEIMLSRGFQRVINLEGGIQAWQAAGLPLLTP